MSIDTGTPTSPSTPALAWPAPSPLRRGGLRGRRAVVAIAAAAIVAAGAVTGWATMHGGTSSDGTFSSGDCVVLTSTAVRLSGCGGQHDGRITAVLHQTYESCPVGSEEFDVTDQTGNLCIDRSK